MVYFNKVKMLDTSSSYSFKHSKNVRVLEKDYDIHNILLIDDPILLFDPSSDEIKLALDLKKEVVLLLSYVKDDYIQYLTKVKKILVFEKLEELALKNHNVKNYSLIKPTLPPIEIINEQTDKVLILDQIDSIKTEDANFIADLSYNVSVIYRGYKIMNNNRDFDNIMKVLNSKAILRYFPILDYEKILSEGAFLLSFIEQQFPITIYRTIEYGNIPFLINNRYRSWILPELQTRDMSRLIDIYRAPESIQEKQKELFDSYFKDHLSFEESINDI